MSIEWSKMPFLGKSVLAGCIFGFALAFAGVTSPAVIITQLNLASFHMLKVFISATAISAYVFPTLLFYSAYTHHPRLHTDVWIAVLSSTSSDLEDMQIQHLVHQLHLGCLESTTAIL